MNYQYDEFEFVNQYLTGGEYVLWKGKPEKGNLLSKGDALAIPLNIVWSALAIWFSVDAFMTGDAFDSLFMIPFLGIAFYTSVGRFMQLASRRKRTWYVITNKKIIRKTLNKVDMLDGGSLPQMKIDVSKDGNGTICFGVNTDDFRVGRKSWHKYGGYTFTLENIKEPDKVRDIINGMDA